ncbi:transmembrane protein [Perilla frutescens var. frutescens]|nr:transmembrane protein [Perilla frutescens var. frutescens]
MITVVEDRRDGGDAGISGGSSGEEDEQSSLKDTAFLSILRHPKHPCSYFGLAKEALLKCFGLDSSSESSSSRQHEKRD